LLDVYFVDSSITSLCEIMQCSEERHQHLGSVLSLYLQGAEFGFSDSKKGEVEHDDIVGRIVIWRPVSGLHDTPSYLLF
jgi:hypothetical protein